MEFQPLVGIGPRNYGDIDQVYWNCTPEYYQASHKKKTHINTFGKLGDTNDSDDTFTWGNPSAGQGPGKMSTTTVAIATSGKFRGAQLS